MNSSAVDAPGTPGQRRFATEHLLIVSFAAVTLLIHFLTNGRYNFFRDELYYIACGQHLAFGYVDMAPLSALLVRLSRVLFGDSLCAIRFLPAVAGALNVALTGMIARELGGRSWAVALSCTASLCALLFLAVGNFFSMNAFEPLFWMGAIYLLVRIINGTSINDHPLVTTKPREGGSTINRFNWLWFGALIGLGLENKHSMAFFAVGVCAALLFTPERRQLTQKWIWLGGLIALALALPNIIWQVRHDWPTWELLRNIAQSNKNVVLAPGEFIKQQVLIMNPAAFPLWLGGLVWLLASRDGRR
jgi:4-amino-4-deoxy-L-arabinose transferase-like glycosyltransferase